MPFLDALPVGVIAALVFGLRAVDVTIGTVRTIMVVSGRVSIAVVLGFFELLIWATAVAQVVLMVPDHPILVVPYAAGFATGNAIGILLERRLALGSCIVRMLSETKGDEIARALGAIGQHVTLFLGETTGGPKTLVYATCPRRQLPALIETAQRIDPSLFYAVERFSETGGLSPVIQPTGWRSVLKKK
jgi:uncharacterized protein YebE (UPF0316 family)